MDVSDTWVQAELAVNRFDAVCIEQRWSFVPSPANRDFGKDGYVDLSEDGTITGESFFVQIKGGRSYAAGGGGYRIPVDDHLTAWRDSPAAVIGVVHDPKDDLCRWVNLTSSLRDNPTQVSVYVHGGALLQGDEQLAQLTSSIKATHVRRYAPVGLGGLMTSDQGEAVWEAFGLGHRDAAPVIALRRSFLAFDRPAATEAIFVLSHFGDHPDIFWTEKNHPPKPVRDQVASTFRWSVHEVWQLLSFVEDGFDRGTLGQCVLMLLNEDPNLMTTVERLVKIVDDELILGWAVVLTVGLAGGEATAALEDLLIARPDLATCDLGAQTIALVKEFGGIDLMG